MKRTALACTAVLLVVLARPGIAQNTKENADFKLAINLYNDGLYDLAEEQLKQFINAFPNTDQGIEARYYLGLTQSKLKQYDDARLTFQTFALTYQDNPKAPDAWMNVGESYASAGNYKEAALAFERVKVFHPKSKSAPDALLRASRYFTLGGEQANARRVLRIIIQEYPTSGATLAARAQLGQLYFEEGNLDQALSELKRVIEGDPSQEARAQAMLILGNIYQSTGRTNLARSNYEEIIGKYRTTSALQGAYVNLGKLLAHSGDYPEAVEAFRKAAAEKPGTDSSYVKEALINAEYAALKDYTNAVSLYNRFAAAFPGDQGVPDVLWRSALVNRRAGNYKRSAELCGSVLKSGAPEELKRRAQLLSAENALDQRNPALAVQLYTGFIDRYPDDHAADRLIMKAAEIYEKDLHDASKASSYYELVVTRYPRSVLVDDALMGAARCYEQSKDFDRAIRALHELAEKYPSSEFRAQADGRVRMIRTFETREKDAGVEKLALLLGDVVTDKDKIGVSFRLGEIYFNDLKNYDAAARQFTNAISSGLHDRRFEDALYLRSRAYEYLSWSDGSYRQQALDSYRMFLDAFPGDKRSEDAALSVFTLSATSPEEAGAAYAATLVRFPGFTRTDTLLLCLGTLQQAAGNRDSALGTFTRVAEEYASSPSAEEAGFRRIEILRQSNVDSALTVGSGYVGKFPNGIHTAEVLDWIGAIALNRNDAAHAEEFYRRLTEDFPYTQAGAGARRALAEAYTLVNSHERAVALLTELIDEQSSSLLPGVEVDPVLQFDLGKAHHAAGNEAEAKKYLLQFVGRERTGDRAGEAYNLLGLMYRNEGALDLATSYFREAGIAAPGGAASRDVARLLFDSGNYVDAIRQYTQLAEAASSEDEKRQFESQTVIALFRSDRIGDAEKAIAAFEKKYKGDDESQAAFVLERGSYYYRKEEFGNAGKAFDMVMKKYDESAAAPGALYWTGKILESTNKGQEALKVYERLMKEYPGSSIIPRVYLALGNIYYSAERWDESVQNYRHIVDDTTAEPALLQLAMNNLIETYNAAGVYDAALALTRKYLERYPSSDDAFDKKINIGILYQRLGYNDQSVLHLQSLLDEAGSDLEGEIRYYIAEANYNKGDYQQAILDFLKVPYLVTKKGKLDWTANSLYMSGQSYEKMGRFDQALTMYQQIVDRPGIDGTFKAAARKEIDRVKLVLKKPAK